MSKDAMPKRKGCGEWYVLVCFTGRKKNESSAMAQQSAWCCQGDAHKRTKME
jgi:hypothetical protein